MREILFRGKRLDNGEWVYGTVGSHTSLDAMIIERPYPTQDNDLTALGFWVVDPDTVGQYTGWNDAVGVKIFEEDICLGFGDTVVIEWHKHGAMFRARSLIHPNTFIPFTDIATSSMLTVIGNRYDNPKLFEEGTVMDEVECDGKSVSLFRCPYCDSDPLIHSYRQHGLRYSIQCGNEFGRCRINLRTPDYMDLEQAAADWNMRVEREWRRE